MSPSIDPPVERSVGQGPRTEAVVWERELRLLDLASVPLRGWRTIALVTLATIALGLLIVLLFPRPYRAETILLPLSDESESSFSLLSLMSDVPLGLGPLTGLGTQQDVIGAILRSRSVADSVIRRMDLVSVWEMEDIHAARKELEARTTLELNDEDGSVRVAVEDGDSERATRIANAYPDIMNEVSGRLAAEEARRRQEFLESQIAPAREELEASENRFVEFLRGNEIPAVEEQARVTIETAARLEGEMIAKELELAQLRRFSTPDNPDLRRAQSELGALRGQLRELTRGRAGGEDDGIALLTFREAPELGMAYAGLLREYEKNQQIYMSLSAGFAEARLRAVGDLPIVNVLDPAVPPEERAGIGPVLFLLLAAMTGLLLGTGAALTRDWVERARADAGNQSFFESWAKFRSDMKSARFWRR